MIGNLKRSGQMLRVLAVFTVLLCKINFGFSLNSEGLALLRFKGRVISDRNNALASWKHDDGSLNPCSWSGVHCSSGGGGDVVALEQGDLSLEGTPGPELGQQTNLKSKKALRHKKVRTHLKGEGEGKKGKKHHHKKVKRFLKGERGGEGEGEGEKGKEKHRKKVPPPPLPPPPQPPLSTSPPPPHKRHHSPELGSAPLVLVAPVPAAAPSSEASRSSNKGLVIVLPVVVVSVLVLASVISYFLFRKSNASVRPWIRTVPKFERSKLEMACEDFTSILSTFCDGIVYKGTLSKKDEVFANLVKKDADEDENEGENEDKVKDAVGIAVTTTSVTSVEGWSKSLEAQFRNKMDRLSKINHENFANLIAYCKEEEPFTRMMVFEYAPNGTLFEHLHSVEKDSESLSWITRLRIALGIACCLEYMHQLSPPIAQWNLQSSSIYLAEDFAPKISDFSQVIAEKTGFETPQTNLYSFGIILFELITGRFPPFSADEVLNRPLREIVDPTLHSYKEEDIEKLAEMVKRCVSPNPKKRPRMREIVARLKKITDAAKPKPIPPYCEWRELLKTLNTEIPSIHVKK